MVKKIFNPAVIVLLLVVAFIIALSSAISNIETEPLVVVRDFNPVWSHDGTKIVFESIREENWDVLIYDFGDASTTNLTIESASNEYSPVWLPDDTALIYVGGDEINTDLYRHDLATNTVEALTSTEDRKEFAPSLSADGRYLTYGMQTVDDEGAITRQDLYLYDFETEETTTITGAWDTALAGLPNWSAIDNQLLFANDVDGVSHLWLFNPDDASLEEITGEGNASSPHWSPDNQQIAMVSDRAESVDVWVLDIASGDYSNLTPDNPDTDSAPVWSPDGERIAYGARTPFEDTTRNDVWVVDVATGRQRNVTADLIEAWSPAWSPDGEQIAFVGFGVESTIWVINPATLISVELTGDE